MRYRAHQWEHNEVVQHEDMNRIEENIEELDTQGLKKGADLSDAKVNEIRDITEEFPVPEQGELLKNIIGKIRKFFLDFKILKDTLATKSELIIGLTKAKTVITITLTASGWTGSAAPYVQTVNAPSVTEDMNPVLVRSLADGAPAATQAAYNKAFAIVVAGTGTTGNGTVTFKAYKKPAADINVGLKGV